MPHCRWQPGTGREHCTSQDDLGVAVEVAVGGTLGVGVGVGVAGGCVGVAVQVGDGVGVTHVAVQVL
jgi:hypothetical protein